MKVEKLVEQFFTAGDRANASGHPDDLHALRIAGKRLRYLIEILDPEGGERRLTLLRRLQDQLGDMHDCVVAERYLQALPSSSAKAQTVAAVLHKEADGHITKAQKAWARSFGPKSQDAWLAWAATISLP